MKVKEVEPEERCPTCNRVTKHVVEAFFCDNCDKQLSEEFMRTDRLNISIFKKPYTYSTTEEYYFCTWKCVKEWLHKNKKKLKSPEFHFLTFQYVSEGNWKEFFECFLQA